MWVQATVSRVCFSPGSPNILISAGLDKSIILTDRRLDAAIAKVQGSLPLTALDCKDNGNCITVGTTSESSSFVLCNASWPADTRGIEARPC